MKDNVKDTHDVEYAEIHWFHATNIRKAGLGNPMSDINWKMEPDEDGTPVVKGLKPDGLVYSLSRGWDSSQGAVKVSRATQAEATAAVKEREAMLKEWESKEETKLRAATMRQVWFPNGKPVAVKFVANEAYRRSIGIQGVFIRRSMDAETKPWSNSFRVTVNVVEFANAREKFESHLLENGGKDQGRLPLSEVDIFFAYKELLNMTGGTVKESELFKLGFKRGRCQKAYALAKLDYTFPSLNIAERLRMPVESKESLTYSPTGPLPIRSMKHQSLLRLKNGYKYNTTGETASDRIKVAAMPKAIESYFRDAINDAESAREALTVSEVLDYMKNSPVTMLQWLAEQFQTGGNVARNATAMFVPVADKLNVAIGKVVDLSELEPSDTEPEEETEEETETETKRGKRETAKA